MSRTIVKIVQRSSGVQGILIQTSVRTLATAVATETSKRTGDPETAESWAAAKPYTDIPGPRPFPILGNMVRFMPGGNLYGLSPMEIQQKLFKSFGPIIRLAGLPGRGDILWLFEPEDVCKVFRNEGPMPIRDSVPCIYHYRTVVRPQWFEGVGGALIAQGEEWYNFRTKVNKLMLEPKSVRRYVDPVDEVSEEFVEIMHGLRDKNQELPADFQNELFKWGLEAVVAIALDTRLGCLAPDAPKDSEAQRMIAASQRIFGAMDAFQIMPILWRVGRISPLWRQFVRDFDLMTETARKYTRRTMANLEAEKAAGEDGASASDKEPGREPSVLVRLLKAEQPTVASVLAADILTGGTETTSKSMATVLTNLARFPDEQSALAEELRRELPERHPRITSEALNRLPRLRAFLRESMRFTPTVPALPRTTIQNMVLSGYKVPKGTEVLAAQLLMCRQECNMPQADEFRPERWLRSSALHGKGHAFASLPFGFGPRMCLGKRFAEMEMQVLTAKIVHRYNVEYHYGEMPFQGSPMYGPSGPLKFRLIERD